MMDRLSVHILLGTLVAAVGLLVLTGCKNTVEPFADTERHFAIYGFLDAESDTQVVRIEPTRPVPDAEVPTGEGLTVSTTDLASGDVVFWQPAPIQLEDGSRGLAFRAEFRPGPGRSYELSVHDQGGRASSVATRVPTVEAIRLDSLRRTFFGTLEQPIALKGLDRQPEAIAINYEVARHPADDPVRVTVEYSTFGVPVADGWQIDVRLTRDREQIDSRLATTPDSVLYLHSVSTTLRLLSADWPLPFDERRAGNVTDGFGFFGAAATQSFRWVMDSAALQELGYEDRQSNQGRNTRSQ